MQTLAQLESNAIHQPNSVELKQALAERYFEQGRWEEAARAYRVLASLHTSTASLFINRIRLDAAALIIASAAFEALIALGGVGLGLSLWSQASGAFEAGMDRSSS